MKALTEAIALISTIQTCLAKGIKHYRMSDGAELTTVKEVLEALVEDGGVTIEEPKPEALPCS
jgi:hypothetical protein